MAKYDRKQLEALAKTAGFSDYSAWLWSFIALAESGGDPTVVGKNTDGSTDTGLWQINSIHRKANPEWTEEWLKNPVNNAKAAYALAKGDKTRKGKLAGTQPWYSSEESRGDYKGWKQLAKENQEDPKEGYTDPWGEQIVDNVPGVSETIDAAKGAIEYTGKAAMWIGNPRNWLRVGYVVGGLALVVGGATLIAKPAIAKATDIVPVGKIAKIAKGAKAA